mmetsp:Transcript_28270/g.90575  ORF Transcript_28270/g.90575 Transcript_28270/m.90575 type:complete len:235 (+) Transcript_28270:668-1372(+)
MNACTAASADSDDEAPCRDARPRRNARRRRSRAPPPSMALSRCRAAASMALTGKAPLRAYGTAASMSTSGNPGGLASAATPRNKSCNGPVPAHRAASIATAQASARCGGVGSPAARSTAAASARRNETPVDDTTSHKLPASSASSSRPFERWCASIRSSEASAARPFPRRKRPLTCSRHACSRTTNGAVFGSSDGPSLSLSAAPLALTPAAGTLSSTRLSSSAAKVTAPCESST